MPFICTMDEVDPFNKDPFFLTETEGRSSVSRGRSLILRNLNYIVPQVFDNSSLSNNIMILVSGNGPSLTACPSG